VQSRTKGVPLGVPLGAVEAAKLLACVGLVRTVWVWAARRGAAALRGRARRTRLSAVTLAAGSAVLLAAALATMPATHAAQQAYWQDLDPHDLHWQQRVLDAPLLEQLPPLPQRFFRLDDSQNTNLPAGRQVTRMGRCHGGSET